MRFSAFIGASLVVLAVAEPATNPSPAPVITDNPAGKTYVATFDNPVLFGNITASSGADGKGVDVVVRITIDLDKDTKANKTDLGDFSYHIHDQPVGSDGNCTKTLAHLDFYQVGQNRTCNPSSPELCEGGDLAGKHGKIPYPPDYSETKIVYHKKYLDLYLSTKEGEHNFFGNRSVVIHRHDKTRLACANFVLLNSSDATGSKTPDNHYLHLLHSGYTPTHSNETHTYRGANGYPLFPTGTGVPDYPIGTGFPTTSAIQPPYPTATGAPYPDPTDDPLTYHMPPIPLPSDTNKPYNNSAMSVQASSFLALGSLLAVFAIAL